MVKKHLLKENARKIRKRENWLVWRPTWNETIDYLKQKKKVEDFWLRWLRILIWTTREEGALQMSCLRSRASFPFAIGDPSSWGWLLSGEISWSFLCVTCLGFVYILCRLSWLWAVAILRAHFLSFTCPPNTAISHFFLHPGLRQKSPELWLRRKKSESEGQ